VLLFKDVPREKMMEMISSLGNLYSQVDEEKPGAFPRCGPPPVSAPKVYNPPMIDLHTHSTASDGSLSPAALLELAAGRGVTALALTDHDTVAGFAEARAAAETHGIRFIPGVELEITWESGTSTVAPPGEFHLLGLGLTRPGPAFFDALAVLTVDRERRNREILGKLVELGVEADYEELCAIAQGKAQGEARGGGSIGRPHIAELLIRRGVVKNHEQAFSRYLGKGRPFYAPRQGLRFADALAIIKESGGIPVLAHPLSLFVAWGRLPGLIGELAEQGLQGIEAWHPTAKPRSCSRLEQLGRDLGLYVTEGSDFHGAARPDRKLGCSAEGRTIDEEVLERIPPLAAPQPNCFIME
jgi:predicted metal-dependent phosphoesterase TrpH